MLRLISFFFTILLTATAFCQTTIMGGRGMHRVFSAETIQAGSIFLNSYYFSFFTGDEAGLGRDQTWSLGLTYGLSNSVELTAQFVPYQDDQQNNWAPPGDTRLGIKWRTPVSSRALITGIRGLLILPTAKNHNVPFEPFSSGKVAWGVTGLATFDFTRSVYSLPVKIHANVGYLDHDISSPFSTESTDQLLVGLGVKIPLHPFILYTEYTGEFFVNSDSVQFGDNSMRLTQGAKFVGPFNVLLDFGVDIGLSRTRRDAPVPIHDYADWKIFGGLTFHFTTQKVYGYALPESTIDSKKEKRALQQIKEKRDKVDEELEKLQKKLEKEKEEKPPPFLSRNDMIE